MKTPAFNKIAAFAEPGARAEADLAQLAKVVLTGRIRAAAGLVTTIGGLAGVVTLGERVRIAPRAGPAIGAEVIAIREGTALALCHDRPDGIGLGDAVTPEPGGSGLPVCDGWIGRVIDAAGKPLDQRGPLPHGPVLASLRASPPPAVSRARLGARIDLGVPALDLFATCRAGQRLGLFAGSGVGKSTLLAMLARNTACDVVVLALVGERGREVRDFLEDDLGPEGAARCVTVVATSDESPLRRRDAAHVAMAVAEHFRDAGRKVLLLMDSVTRYCMALREIGLAAGESPATRGYPPSVFADLPRLLERAGPGLEVPDGHSGLITAVFTVLVDGGDHDEPVADAVRGTLDGHVVLDRTIAERGRYPAIDVPRSLSRAVPACLDAMEWQAVRTAREALGQAGDLADLVRLGAYEAGRDAAADRALALAPRIEALISQERHVRVSQAEAFARLAALLGEQT